MTVNDMVAVDLVTGKVVEGNKKNHLQIPQHTLRIISTIPNYCGVVHTHSRHATAWA